MNYSVDEILISMLSMARHIRTGDVQSATLMLLMELGFQLHSDGFLHLRKAINIRFENQQLRLNEVYALVGKSYSPVIGISQIEHAIRFAISNAWKNGNKEMWNRLFPGAKSIEEKAPSNGEFIVQLSYIIELWDNYHK